MKISNAIIFIGNAVVLADEVLLYRAAFEAELRRVLNFPNFLKRISLQEPSEWCMPYAVSNHWDFRGCVKWKFELDNGR